MKATVWKKEMDLVHYLPDEIRGVEIPDELVAQYDAALKALLDIADRMENIADEQYTRRSDEERAKFEAEFAADNAARRAAAYARRSALMSSSK